MSNAYEVGDEADLGPALMNKFISDVIAQGGKVQIKGNKAVVTHMPVKAAEPKKAAPKKKAPASED